MKKFLALLLVAVLALSMVACKKDEENKGGQNTDLGQSEELVYNNFKYAVGDDGNYEILGYVFDSVAPVDLVIPTDIEGRAITGIAAEAFYGATNVKSVTLPASLQYIGDNAFCGCIGLTAIVIPDSVTTVGEGAFRGCSALAAVTFSKGLTRICDFAFMDCAALTNFTLHEGLISIGISAFDGCKALTAVTIPSTVIEIGDTAFYGCSNLEAVTANVVATDADIAMVQKMNDVLAAHETATGVKPLTASDAFDVLEAAGLYVGGINENGIKYVWDKAAKQIVGAFGTADTALIAKMNGVLAAAKEDPADMYKLEDVLTAAGLNLDNLNSVIEMSKYQWLAEANCMVITYTIGETVFHGTKAGFTVYTNPGSPMAVYAAQYHNVSPLVPDGAGA